MVPAAENQRLATPTAAPAAALPFISVVIPVRNEARHIAETLRQLTAQDYDTERFEVLVADGRSTDATRAVVEEWQARHANVYLIDNARRLSSAGRNRAIEAARGDMVVIVDGHCDLRNPRYLRDLAAAFEHSGADAVGRPQPLDVTGATALQRAVAAARSSWLGHNPSSHIYSDRPGFVPPQSVAVAYRREVFGAVGLFDESFDACEDVEFNHRLDRAGFTCYLDPQTRVYYHPRASLRGLFRQLARYGRGRVRLFRKHGDTLSAAILAPAVLLVGVILGAIAAALVPSLAVPYLAALAFYAAVVLAVSTQIASRERDVRLLGWLPLVFAAVHAGAGFGVLWELATGRRRRATERRFGLVERGEAPREITTAALNALTFDVEDYFHVTGFERMIDRSQWGNFESRVVASTRTILDTLAYSGVRATFFVLGWVAERHPGLVREIRTAGHEIGSHGYWHRLIYTQTPEEFRADIRRSRDVLQGILGEPVTAYRAPSFSITARSLWALDVLIEEGFTADSSIFPTWHDRYGLAGATPSPHRLQRPAGELLEFPLPIRKVLGYPLPAGGGGYFRLYPYALTRRLLRGLNAAGRPFVTYLHPWEFDPEQPRFRPGRLRAFRHYVNLRRTRRRLEALLGDFRFGTLTEALHAAGLTAATPKPALARAA
jgi:polysaccharide deacetylase family protein (PEP-CTERM system associated)